MQWKCNFESFLPLKKKSSMNHMVNWIEFSTVLNLSHLRVDEEKVSHWAAATRFHRWAPSALMCLSCTALWTLLHCKKYGPRRFCTQKANILVEVYFSLSFHNMRPRFPLWFRYTYFPVGKFHFNALIALIFDALTKLTALIALKLHSHHSHIVLILHSHCTHIALTLHSHCTHIALISL